jgi:AraC-like DNA-binding protein
MPRTTPNLGGPTYCPNPLAGVTCFQEVGSTHAYRVWHEDWYCFCLVMSGAGDVRYRNRTLRFEPERTFVFSPGEVHETLRVLTPGTYRVLMLPAIDVHLRAESQGRRDVQLPMTLEANHPLATRLRRLTDALFDTSVSQPECELRYEQLLEHMVAYDERSAPTPDVARAEAPRVVRAVREYLLANDNRNLKLADVSRALGWSAGYISRVFSEHGYCPPKTLLRLRQVGNGRRLLIDNPEDLIKSAALESGFPAVEKFNAAFRVAWNMTPTEYLRQHGRRAKPVAARPSLAQMVAPGSLK